MLQHSEFCTKKSPKRKKGRNILPSPEVKGERRPLSTGDLRDKKVWRKEDDVFDRRPRATTYHGQSTSSFHDYTNTATCYNCFFDTKQGRQFCEIMGSKYCHQCIRASRKKDLDEQVSCASSVSENNQTSFSDTVLHARHSPSMAPPNDTKWFTRLHNLNSVFYINPLDDMRTNLVSSRRNLTCGSSSLVPLKEECDRNLEIQLGNHDKTTQNHLLFHIPRHDKDTAQKLEESLSRKKRKLRAVSSKRKFVTFNGLPIEPPLITVDLSNQIMNHTAVNDFELTLYRS